MENPKIYQAIAAIMSEVEAIGKDKQNVKQNFKFRGIDDVYNALHPLLAKHKVFTVPEVLSKESTFETSQHGNKLFYERLMVRYTFFADDGSSFQSTVYGIGMDSGDKAANKAMAIAHKYVLLQVFAIPTEDMIDPDAETPDPSMDQRRPEERHQTSNGAPRSQSNQRPPAARQPARPAQQPPASQQQQPSKVPTNGQVTQNLTTIPKERVDDITEACVKNRISSAKWKKWLQGVYGYGAANKILMSQYAGIMLIASKKPEIIKNYGTDPAVVQTPPLNDMPEPTPEEEMPTNLPFD